MVKLKVVLVGHAVGNHVVAHGTRRTTIQPLPTLVVARAKGFRQHGIAQVAVFGCNGSAISLTGNVIGVKHDDTISKAFHLLVLYGIEVKFLLPPLTSVYVPEIPSAYAECHMIPAVFLKMRVVLLVDAKRTHRIIHAKGILRSAAEHDVASLYVGSIYPFLFQTERAFRLAIPGFVLHPNIPRFGVLLVRFKLLNGRMNGCGRAIAIIHGVGKNLIAHEPTAHLAHAVVVASRKDDRVAFHGRTKQTAAGPLRFYDIRSKTNEKWIPGRAINDLAHLIAFTHYVR